MTRVMLKCKNDKCHRDFYAGIETTEGRFPKLDLLPGRETCPHCNEILIYDIPDFLKDLNEDLFEDARAQLISYSSSDSL